MRRSRIAALAAAVATAAVLAVPAAAAVATAEAGPAQAMVRVAHFSPDASYVDVYMVSLNRKQLFPNVFYKSVSSYWRWPRSRSPTRCRRQGPPPNRSR